MKSCGPLCSCGAPYCTNVSHFRSLSLSRLDRWPRALTDRFGDNQPRKGKIYIYRLTYVLISADRLVNIARGKLVELLVVAEDYDGDIDRAQHRQLVSFLEEASLAFEKGAGRVRQLYHTLVHEQGSRANLHLHGTVPVILDGLDLDLPATHFRHAQTALRMRDGLATRQLMVAGRC